MTREELLAVAKPALFNTEMVRAILEDRKTVTRRSIKPRYRDDECGFQVLTTVSGEFVRVEKIDENGCGIFADGSERYLNPSYNIGDILYVRETWCRLHPLADDMCTPTGEGKYYYAADGYNPTPFNSFPDEDGFFGDKDCPRWRPSIHMPKEAARIFLRVTSVRAERLQDITEEQIKKEGVNTCQCCPYEPTCNDFTTARICRLRSDFAQLWDSTVKKEDLDRYGWNANPHVWVYEFERITVQ